MPRVFFIAAWIIISQSPAWTKSIPPSNDEWSVVKIFTDDYKKKNYRDYIKDIVTLQNGTTIDNIGYLLKFVHKLDSKDASPLLIFTGMPCIECDVLSSLFVHSIKGKRTEGFLTPDKDVDTTGGGPNAPHESRAFIGHCFSTKHEQLVVYTSVMNDGWIKTLYVITNNAGSIETTKETSEPTIDSLMQQISKKKACKEIKKPGLKDQGVRSRGHPLAKGSRGNRRIHPR